MRCKQCGREMERVRRPADSPLNGDQFDAVRAGDYYCANCRRYWWERDGDLVPSDRQSKLNADEPHPLDEVNALAAFITEAVNGPRDVDPRTVAPTARPATGATDAQIEAAKDALVRQRCGLTATAGISGAPLWQINRADDQVDSVAPHLVPPGTVIAPAEHVVSTADREAFGRAHYVLTQVLAVRELQHYGITPDDLARMERLGRDAGQGHVTAPDQTTKEPTP